MATATLSDANHLLLERGSLPEGPSRHDQGPSGEKKYPPRVGM